MNTNLDTIALDLYGKIQTRFPNIKMGDENAGVLSKRSDIPKARFFEFEYKDNGRSLGTVAITLDEDDGILVQLTGDIANKHHEGAFKFIRGLRSFAKDRLIKFDVQNLAKDQLDKRDYQFQAKPKEQPVMQQPMQQQQPAPKQAPKSAEQSSMMESKMYGTNRMSYQDLGDAKLIVRHSQPINPEVAAGRTMHIEGIWVENAQGERFKYPYKHLHGARALAEHLKHGGNPYDGIGQYIAGLSEELAQLRKFKGYVGRNSALSEAMGGITDKVAERIESVKKEVFGLQRPAYYQAFAESFEAHTDEMIPEEIMSDFIDRLTIRTFNEDLRTAFPYIFRLIDESELPVRELTADDLLGEESVEVESTGSFGSGATNPSDPTPAQWAELKRKAATGDPRAQAYVKQGEKRLGNKKWEPGTGNQTGNVAAHTGTNLSPATAGAGRGITQPEDQFENFIESIVAEDELSQDGEDQLGDNALFSPNKSTQQAAVDKFNEIMKTELKGGPNGINIIDSLKGLIDDPEFVDKMKDIDPDLDARSAIQQELKSMSEMNPGLASILPNLNFKGDGSKTGGEEVLPTPTTPPEVPPPAPDASAVPPAPETMPPEAVAMPPAPEAPPAPMAENADDLPWDTDPEDEKSHFKKPHNPNRTGRDSAKALSHAGLLKAIQMAKKSGASLDTKLDFGHKEMTLHDCIRECGLTPMECGFEDDSETSGNPVEQMLKSIAGFWNKEQKNFTIGGTRAKVKIIKDFKNGEFKNATPEDVKQVIALIDRMDPSSDHNQELGHIKHLAGLPGSVQ